MKALIVTSHGALCKGLLETAEMLVGKLENTFSLSLDGEGITKFSESMDKLISDLKDDYDEILILCDLKGGTPYNESMKHFLMNQDVVKIVAGVNLPMFVEVYMQLQSLCLEELRKLVIETGQLSISN
ncbi:PTS sugar transporter subunit IIA [Ectobacillus polymachus]|uniref:PTS sugar transporter subunit IIA n=1 Tax=Ectobacillus polymachus TaxID=1508806 RepID=UPI003A8C66CA